MATANPLDYAIQMEQDGQRFYAEAAAATASPLGRKMLESLAADERRHEQVLRRIAERADAAMEGDMPKRRLVTLFAQLGPQARAELGAEPDDTQVIEKALEMERASVELYAGQAASAEGESPKALYERLAAEERQHVEILHNTLAYLNASAQWFLWDEQALLDGG